MATILSAVAERQLLKATTKSPAMMLFGNIVAGLLVTCVATTILYLVFIKLFIIIIYKFNR